MALRTVALETPRRREVATVWDPTGWAVSTYSSTIARRISAFRDSIMPRSLTAGRGTRPAGARSLSELPSLAPLASVAARAGSGARLLAVECTECQWLDLAGGKQPGGHVGRQQATPSCQDDPAPRRAARAGGDEV